MDYYYILPHLNKNFDFSKTNDCYQYSEGFNEKKDSSQTTANFINCTQQGSYITLNNYSSSAQYYKSQDFDGQIFVITFDLIFFGIWNELENLTYSINNQKYAWIYNNSIQKVEIQGFCDSKQAFIQIVNFTINQTSIKGIHQFTIFTLMGNVSIKNFIYSTLKCHPNCKQCWGDLPNHYWLGLYDKKNY